MSFSCLNTYCHLHKFFFLNKIKDTAVCKFFRNVGKDHHLSHYSHAKRTELLKLNFTRIDNFLALLTACQPSKTSNIMH